MTKVCLLVGPAYKSFEMTTEQLLAHVLFVSKEKLKCGDTFKYKENFYNISCARPKDNLLIAEIFEYTEKIKYCEELEITCPYCSSQKMDSWERGEGEDEEICDICGSTFSWEKETCVTYSSTPINKAECLNIKDFKND